MDDTAPHSLRFQYAEAIANILKIKDSFKNSLKSYFEN